MKSIILLCLGLCLGFGATAQRTTYGGLSGQVLEFREDEAEQNANTGLPGAVVRVIAGKDTLQMAAMESGVFWFDRVPTGLVRIEATFLGYESYGDTLTIRRGFNARRIYLKPVFQQIDQVVVEGETPLFTQRGDTLVYNAAAVKTMQGDETMRILEQLPGVLTDEFGRVVILGKVLARTYVNNRLIYGNDPAAALKALLAEEVVQLKVYDEATDEDRRRGITNGEKQRVLDIRTRTPIVSAFDGHFLGSYGADFSRDADGRRQQRYGAGATANFYSEMLLLSANAFVNNVGRSSNRLADLINTAGSRSAYEENKFVEVGLEKYWRDRRDGSNMKAGYSYDNSYSRTSSRSLRDYFATADNPAMRYADTSRYTNRSGIHTAYLNLDLQRTSLGSVMWENSFSHTDSRNDSRRGIMNRTADGERRTTVANREKRKNYRLQERLLWMNQESMVSIAPRLILEAELSDDDRSGWRLDTLSLNLPKKVLESDYTGPARRFGASAGVNPILRNKKDWGWQLRGEYGIEYQKYKRKQTAYNLYDEPGPAFPLDTTNTYDYTYDYLTHRAMVGVVLNTPRIGLTVNAERRYSSLNRDERFPETTDRRQRFDAWQSFFYFHYRPRLNPVLALTYHASNTLPSVEQLRDRIDDRNPLLLTGGNPDLKQTYIHSLTLRFTPAPGRKGNVFYLTADARFLVDNIASRSFYYAETTRLPAWNDYEVSAGSTLYTYANVNGTATVNVRGIYSRRLKALKSTLETQAGFGYARQPSYNGSFRNVVKEYTPFFRLGLRGTLSRNLRLGIVSVTRYRYARNRLNDDTKLLSEDVSAEGQLDFLKRFFLHARYGYSLYRYCEGGGTDTRTQVLNLVLGCKALKGRGGISIAAYDLLNRGGSYRSAVYSNYLEQTWTPSYGRYFTVNLSFRFNKVQSGTQFQGELRDGSTRKY